jgi:hypothetical protein
MAEPIGLIAGQGLLPVLEARGMRAAGRSVGCVALGGQVHPDLRAECDRFASTGIIRLGRWIRLLRRWGAREAVIVGRVNKARIYEPLRLLRQIPDLRAARVWFRALRHDKRSHALLGAVADELHLAGIELIDSTRFIAEHVASRGILTSADPTDDQNAAIEYALPIVRRLAELDIGQSIAVTSRQVVAVEAIEGTDAMIDRAGDVCTSGSWVLVKVAKAAHDMRFDVPSVGPDTIARMKAGRAACLAIEAGRTIILDKQQTLADADRAGISVVGI